MCVRVPIWLVERLEEREHSSPPGKPKLSRWERTQGRLPWFEPRARAAPLAPEASSAPWSCARTPDSARQVGGWGGLGVLSAEDAYLEGKLPLFFWGSAASPLPGPLSFLR